MLILCEIIIILHLSTFCYIVVPTCDAPSSLRRLRIEWESMGGKRAAAAEEENGT